MSNRGHNNPPDMAETANDVLSAINEWLKENPVVQTEEDAKAAKVQIDRGKLCAKDLDAERDSKVRPLNEQVKEINAHYKQPKTLLENVVSQVQTRLGAYLHEVERQRQEAAEQARLAAEAAEQAARDAEALEQERIDAARTGELGVDIASANRAADESFKEYERASRFAARAERDTKVRVGGGLQRASGLRNVETIIIADPLEAFKILYPTDDLDAALIKAARAYRKTYGNLPTGIALEVERKL